MRNPVEQLCFQLENAFEGEPWYGDPMITVLEEIAPETAHTVHQGRSILRLGRHILSWRVYVLRKLQGDSTYDIELNSPTDWPDDGAMDWPMLLRALRENQTQLLEALRAFPEAQLLAQVPGRNYRFVFLVEGIVQHDIYHLGQIALLRKLL